MSMGSKELPQPSNYAENHDHKSKILSGQLITTSIPVGDLSLYQRAGLDTGYKVLHVADEGQTYTCGRRRYITEPGKNGVPHLRVRIDIQTQQVRSGNLAVSIEKPRNKIGFRPYERRLRFLREQNRRQP